jgi:hypothetical protein
MFRAAPTNSSDCDLALSILRFCLRRRSRFSNQGRLMPPPVDRHVPISPESLADFEAAARRPLAQRLRYAFIKTYKPVLDDVPYRSFESTAEYRQWCEANLPRWLGYGRV